ncbi:MAG: hypothetical protein WCO93_09390, partial [bacterium]
DHTRKAKSEFWISKDKMNRTRGNMIYIVREDLKLKWSVNLSQKTYYEFPDQKEKREKERKGLYTYGINYEPQFEWKESKPDTQTVNGFRCHLVRLNGEADFAGTKIAIWICDDHTYPNAGKLNDLLLNSLSNKDEMIKVVEILKRYSQPLLVKLDEVCENAIAPTMSVTLTISEAGEIVAPPGIFNLPEGLTKSVN